jgi:hypothetical protein
MMTISLLGFEDTIETVARTFQAEVLFDTWYSSDCLEGSTDFVSYTVAASEQLEQRATDWIRVALAQGLVRRVSITIYEPDAERSTTYEADGSERSTTWP